MAALTTLMIEYCDGDAAAFRELYAQLAPGILRYLLGLARNRSDAEDLLQQTFLKLHRSRATYIRGADPVPWIFSIAHRTFVDHVRKQQRTARRLAEVAAPALAVERTGELDDRCAGSSADPELVASVLAALGQIAARQREAVTLTKLQGKSVLEAAAIAGTSVTAMKVRAHRGYEALRRVLRVEPVRRRRTAGS